MMEVIVALEHYNIDFTGNFIKETLIETDDESPSLALFNKVKVAPSLLEKFSIDEQTLAWIREELIQPIKGLYKEAVLGKTPSIDASDTLRLWSSSYEEAKKLLPVVKERYPGELTQEYILILAALAEMYFQGLILILGKGKK